MKKYFLTVTTLLAGMLCYGQQGFVSVGGDATGGNGSVSFSVGQVAYSAYSNASHIIIDGLQQPPPQSVIPVSLIYFSASPGNNRTVNLTWSTASEYNSDYFVVERSGDGKIFSALTQIPSAGNSSIRMDYATVDENPLTGNNYYRLKQVDKDGKTSYSQVEKVFVGAGELQAAVYPNPARNWVYLKMNVSDRPGLTYRLHDLNGKVVQRGVLTDNTTRINLSALPANTYVLQIMEKNEKVQSFRVVKQ